MATLPESRIADLLRPYLAEIPAELPGKLSVYLALLLRWNAKVNLTAIRDPETIVQRHFGEGLFAAEHLRGILPAEASILDFGSGAGFPGLPVQLLVPDWRVTLAESQTKKSAFLQEAVRALGLPHTEVWAGRADGLPPGRRFHAVTLRAVDRPEHALREAALHVDVGGWLLRLHGGEREAGSSPLPQSENRWLTLSQSA
jgi:16S rRNA (guanine527-N7)-methyltransferase